MKKRAGFTLWEMAIVLLMMTTLLVVPKVEQVDLEKRKFLYTLQFVKAKIMLAQERAVITHKGGVLLTVRPQKGRHYVELALTADTGNELVRERIYLPKVYQLGSSQRFLIKSGTGYITPGTIRFLGPGVTYNLKFQMGSGRIVITEDKQK